jgi:hypothetical protein
MESVFETMWPLLFIPSICVFGLVTNLINIAVFLNPQMKDFSFKYMLASSLSDFLYLGLGSYSFMDLCDECPLHNNFLTQV